MYNHSSQRILKHPSFPVNSLQISDVNGKWVPTGETLASFAPGAPLHHEFYYATDRVNGKYGTEAVLIQDVPAGSQPRPDPYLYEIPPDLQELAPQATTWADSEVIQVQVTLAPLATGQSSGRAFILIDQVSLEAQ